MQEIRLGNPQSVRRLVQRTINQLLNGEIENDKARVIGYLCTVLLRSQEQEEMADRMTALEKQILKRGA